MRRKLGRAALFVLMLALCLAAGYFGMTALKGPLGLNAEEAPPGDTSPAPAIAPGELIITPETQTPETPPPETQAPETQPPEATTPPPAETAETTVPVDTGALRAAIDERLGSMDSDWALCFRELKDEGSELLYYRDGSYSEVDPSQGTPMIAASLIKLWVMAAVYDKAQNEGAEPDEAARALLRSMITSSDNDAANDLITDCLGGGDKAAGMARVNAYAAGIGCKGTSLNRLMLDETADTENLTTVADCALLLEQIYNRVCVNAEASDEMLQMLFGQTYRNKIPAGLPEGVQCGNKTGELGGRAENDVAIVRTDSGDYILCVMCMRPINNANAIKEISGLSALVYEVFTRG